MRTELKSLLRSCAFSAAVLFTGASARADEYVLTVVPVKNDKDQFQIQCMKDQFQIDCMKCMEDQFQIDCMNIDKRQTDALSVTRNLCEKRVSLGTSPHEVMVNLNTSGDHTSFSFEIGSFKFCYTFSSYGGVMKITGGKETDSLQIQNGVDNQTFEIDTVKANMLSITRDSYKTEVIKMHNCNANTVLLTDYGMYKRLLFKTSKGDYIHKVINVDKKLLFNANTVLLTDYGVHERLLFKTSEGEDRIHKVIDVYKKLLFKMIEGDLIGVYEEPLLKTSGENYIHNLILNGAHIWNDGMMKVDGIFCNVNGSVEGCLPSVILSGDNSHSQNAFILRDEDLISNDSTLEEVDSKSKNCTFFSDTSDSRVEHENSFYKLPKKGCYRFILLGNFKCSGEGDVYCLLREEDFHSVFEVRGSYIWRATPEAYPKEVFGTCLRRFEVPAKSEKYNRHAFVSLFKNVKFVNLQIGERLHNGYSRYQLCELKCASRGHALIIIREDGLH